MNVLSHLRLRTKLGLLLGLSVLALVAVIAVAASLVRQRMAEERVDKLRAVVQSTISIAQGLEARVVARELSREQALAILRDDVHLIRFDKGIGYVFAQTLDNMFVLHGTRPALENTQSTVVNETGRPLTELIRDALRISDEGTVTYLFPKPGQTEQLPKLTYVARFAPWDLVFGAGSYVDDMDAAVRANTIRLAEIGAMIIAVVLLAAFLINRDISGSLNRLKSTMERLAKGELTVDIPGTDRRDEVGSMASALLVFKDHLVKEAGLAAAQEQERERAEAEKRAALVDMADRIESETSKALHEVGARTAAMTATAEEMSSSVSRTGNSAQSAATASGHALANAQAVASAAEQLSASIHEISGQVAQSNEVVRRAVTAGAETRTTIEALNEQVARIGAVADMIGEIAAKTNLLALNATIEAARAGDAGKGFAVVASEVKALATQTAHSTQEIAQRIGEVRSATGASVAAVARIEQTIGEINAIASSIAAAVEEQGAATAEIARNVNETALAANEMTNRTAEVSAEAAQTGKHSAEVQDNATLLNTAVGELRHSVIRVVRTSSREVDRRHDARVQVDVPCRLNVSGQAPSTGRVFDISENGASVHGAPLLNRGARGTLQLEGIGSVLPYIVRDSEDDTLHLAFELDDATRAKLKPFIERFAQGRAA
jgi:methyl-accepting chemotaxis protein